MYIKVICDRAKFVQRLGIHIKLAKFIKLLLTADVGLILLGTSLVKSLEAFGRVWIGIHQLLKRYETKK